jgi:hypothetical protein
MVECLPNEQLKLIIARCISLRTWYSDYLSSAFAQDKSPEQLREERLQYSASKGKRTKRSTVSSLLVQSSSDSAFSMQFILIALPLVMLTSV